jgi:signal transduction histidine kinase
MSSLVIALALGAAGCLALWSKLRADALARFDQTLVDTIPDGVLVWGKDGRILVVNPALRRFAGPANHAFAPGMTIGDLLPPDPRKRLERADPGDHIVFNLHQPSGKLLAIEATAGSVQTQTGPIHLAVLRNSTRSVESERRFLESERLAAIGRNTASVCRDLQRLFLPIPLAVEMLKPKANGRRSGDEIWEELERSVKATGDLLRQMNQFARAGRLGEESTAFDMHACVQETVEAFYSQGVPLGSLSLDLSTVPAMVYGPREKFIVALRFLLQRALDATGGGPIVRVRTWDEEEVHLIEVADSGDAIPDSQMDSIFDPVYFTSMEAPESGFGLFNVAATIRELDGTIRADRLEGGWTSFLVQIPRGR